MKRDTWRLIRRLGLGLAVLVPIAWYSANHVDVLNTINIHATYAFYDLGTPAQFTFVVLYCTRPWRKYGPTRALMNKSLSLFLIMFNSLLVIHMFGLRPLDWPWWLLLFRVICDIYMLGAIYYQLWVNIREIWSGYRDDLLRV